MNESILPLFYEETECGSVTFQLEGLYYVVQGQSNLNTSQVMRLYAMWGEDVRCFGVMEPCNGMLNIRRSIPATALPENWPDRVVLDASTPNCWMRWEGDLFDCHIPQAMTKMEDGKRVIAIAYDPQEPFVAMPLFCLMEPRIIDHKRYLTICVPYS